MHVRHCGSVSQYIDYVTTNPSADMTNASIYGCNISAIVSFYNSGAVSRDVIAELRNNNVNTLYGDITNPADVEALNLSNRDEFTESDAVLLVSSRPGIFSEFMQVCKTQNKSMLVVYNSFTDSTLKSEDLNALTTARESLNGILLRSMDYNEMLKVAIEKNIKNLDVMKHIYYFTSIHCTDIVKHMLSNVDILNEVVTHLTGLLTGIKENNEIIFDEFNEFNDGQKISLDNSINIFLLKITLQFMKDNLELCERHESLNEAYKLFVENANNNIMFELIDNLFDIVLQYNCKGVSQKFIPVKNIPGPLLEKRENITLEVANQW